MARTLDLAKRREIATAAFRIITERGVHRTSMSDVAKALEMKRPTLYHYFPDLGAILEVVLDDLHAEVRRFIVDRMAKRSHPLDQLMALLEGVDVFYRERRRQLIGTFQLWAAASASDPETLLAREREFLDPQRHFLVELVRVGVERGRIRECDPAGLVDLCLTLADGMQYQRVTRDPDMSPLLSFIRDHVLEPLRLPSDPSPPPPGAAP